MPRLLLLRHAKAGWASGTMDLDRPLSRRGHGAATLMGGYLRDEGLAPDALTPERLSRAAEDAVGRPVAISAEALAAALDPAACAAARHQTGSSTPAQVAAMLDECRERIAAARELSAEARLRAERARADLRARARDLSRR